MTIRFNGEKYDSVDAMPPDVRQTYDNMMRDPDLAKIIALEQSLEQSAEGQYPEPAGQVLPRAWGKATAAGGVPVPVEFDGVADLGPAVAVYETSYEEVWDKLPHLGTPHATTLVVYRDGFAYREHGKDVHPWRFDDVAVIQSDRYFVSSSGTRAVALEAYTLTRTSGEALRLDDTLRLPEDAVEKHLKPAVFRRLAPPLIERYQAGEALAFGPVTVQQQTGLQLGGEQFAWADIRDIKVDRGRLMVTLHTGKHHEIRVKTIPNVELLGRLIGISFSSAHLIFY
jgi:hypothetical protein